MARKASRSKKRQSPQRFWNWFSDKEGYIARIFREDDPGYLVLQAHLDAYCPGLTGCCPVITPDGYEFFISANGDVALFDAVRTLIAAAPNLRGWTFTAFVPPVAPTDLVSPSGHLLRSGDIWFKLVPTGTRFDVQLAIKGPTAHTAEEVQFGAIMLLQGVLGEYVSATNIIGLQFLPFPHHPEAAGYRPLRDLPGVFGVTFDTSAPMSMEAFWALIAQSQHQAQGDILRQIAWLTDHLVTLDEDDFAAFDHMFHALGNRAYNEATERMITLMTGMRCYFGDTLSDFCSWLVLQGRETYFNVLHDPSSLLQKPVPDLTYAEDASYVCLHAQMRRDGESLDWFGETLDDHSSHAV